MNNIKKISLILIFFFLINTTLALECTDNGLVTGVEVALDDNSFVKDFNGSEGIIYKLNYNKSTGKYDLWLTNKLNARNDMGDNILGSKGIHPENILSDNSELNKILRINTSEYKKIYVKETLKNTGSCDNYKYQTLKHYSYVYNIGESGRRIQIYEFGSKSFYIDALKEKTQYHSMDIEDFYSGDLRIRSWIRKGSNPYSPTYQMFYVRVWLDGNSLEIPSVSRLDSYTHNPLEEGKTYSVRYKFTNPSSTDKKNVTYRFQTWLGDGNPSLVINDPHRINTKTGKKTLNPKETIIYQYNYTIPYEKDEYALSSYRGYEKVWYVDDPILGNSHIMRSCPKIGSLNHSYLTPDIQKETFVQGTTNQGIPYIGSKYLLKEYNAYYNIGVDPGDYDYEIILYRENSTSSWSPYYVNRTTFNEHLNVNAKIEKEFVYPLYDFQNWVDNSVRLDITTIWNKKNWEFCYDTTSRGNFNIDLDFKHLLMSMDLPQYIYSNGGSDTILVRDVLFNLQDYSLNNISLDVKLIDPQSGSESNDFNFKYPKKTDVPAQASYPVPIEIEYTGPNQDKRYIIAINYTYYDELNDKTHSKTIYGDIYTKDDSVSSNYVDIIPESISYDGLYEDKFTNITVKFDNYGNTPLNSNHKVSLYYKNISENDFHLYKTKTVSSSSENVTFSFKPQNAGVHIIKAVVDEDNDISESSTYTPNGEINNELASITLIRDIDLILKKAIPLYDNVSEQGIIPFKIFVYNNGTGGVDDFQIILNISWQDQYWYFNKTFINIPEEGRTFIYNWNVTNVTPGAHIFFAKVIPKYDKKWINNDFSGAMDFCPLPWYNDILECFGKCQKSCIDFIYGRYKAKCHQQSGCLFHNLSFAYKCNGLLKDSYAEFNETHEALCPDASVIRKKKITDEKIVITSTSNCSSLIIKKYPVIFNKELIQMDIIICNKQN